MENLIAEIYDSAIRKVFNETVLEDADSFDSSLYAHQIDDKHSIVIWGNHDMDLGEEYSDYVISIRKIADNGELVGEDVGDSFETADNSYNELLCGIRMVLKAFMSDEII